MTNLTETSWFEALLPELLAGKDVSTHDESVEIVDETRSSRVFRRYNRDLQRSEIVKQLLPLDGEIELESRSRLIREARILARCGRLPGVPAVFRTEGGSRRGEAFVFIQEEIRGRPLSEHVAELRPTNVGQIGCELAGILHRLHRQRIVHSDIKPANIILADDGSDAVTLIDFGISIELAADETRARPLGYTQGFAAPEQLDGHDWVSYCSDIYSLGATLYYLLVGRPPVADGDGNVTKISSFPGFDAIDLDLEAGIMKAVAERPGDRHLSMLEFRDALPPVNRRRPLDLVNVEFRSQESGLALLDGERVFGNVPISIHLRAEREEAIDVYIQVFAGAEGELARLFPPAAGSDNVQKVGSTTTTPLQLAAGGRPLAWSIHPCDDAWWFYVVVSRGQVPALNAFAETLPPAPPVGPLKGVPSPVFVDPVPGKKSPRSTLEAILAKERRQRPDFLRYRRLEIVCLPDRNS